jgi:sphingolipid delta-4 desaturase
MGVQAESAARRTDFVISAEDEPHAIRRAAILKAHPEITKLMGHCPRTKYYATATVLLQVFMAATVRDWSWTWFLAAAYVVGATANHSLFLAIHELSHNLGAKTAEANKFIGYVANLPITIPYSVSFKPYHIDHHKYQGVDGMDLDVPTRLEAYLITKASSSYPAHCFKKFLFCFFQILFYALRPSVLKPHRVPKDKWYALNFLFQIAFDLALLRMWGPNALLYLLVSTFFAGSIHPTAGHFLAEHYVTEGAETYSYYGPLNYLTYHVGYHNEHHDFPNIPGSRLHQVRALAPEFYNNLPECKSWPMIFWWYIFDEQGGPYARVVRENKKA